MMTQDGWIYKSIQFKFHKKIKRFEYFKMKLDKKLNV